MKVCFNYPLLPELPWVLLDPFVVPRDSCDEDLGMVVGVLGTILSLTLLLYNLQKSNCFLKSAGSLNSTLSGLFVLKW